MKRSIPVRRLTIERIVLNVRGLTPASAEAAARALAPALARALAASGPRGHSTDRIDAGEIAYTRAPSTDTLTADVAQRIAQRVHGKED
jgi:hypothetical protein